MEKSVKTFYRRSKGVESFLVTNLERELKKLITTCLGKGGVERVLDVGCGEQPLRKIFRQQNIAYTGLDYKQNKKGTVDFLFSIDKIGQEELDKLGEYDLVICTEVLEHVLDWTSAFYSLKKLVKKGGMLLITAPFVYQLHEEPVDFWRPTPYAIDYFVESTDMRVIAKKFAGDDLDLLGMVLSGMYVMPKTNRLFDRIKSKAFQIWRAIGISLASEPLRDSFSVNGRFYLSNIYLLEK